MGAGRIDPAMIGERARAETARWAAEASRYAGRGILLTAGQRHAWSLATETVIERRDGVEHRVERPAAWWSPSLAEISAVLLAASSGVWRRRFPDSLAPAIADPVFCGRTGQRLANAPAGHYWCGDVHVSAEAAELIVARLEKLIADPAHAAEWDDRLSPREFAGFPNPLDAAEAILHAPESERRRAAEPLLEVARRGAFRIGDLKPASLGGVFVVPSPWGG